MMEGSGRGGATIAAMRFEGELVMRPSEGDPAFAMVGERDIAPFGKGICTAEGSRGVYPLGGGGL
jgi:hypothetical protein